MSGSLYMVCFLQVALLIGALGRRMAPTAQLDRRMAPAAQWQCGSCCSGCFPLIVSPAFLFDVNFQVAKIEEWIATLQFACAELLQLW